VRRSHLHHIIDPRHHRPACAAYLDDLSFESKRAQHSILRECWISAATRATGSGSSVVAGHLRRRLDSTAAIYSTSETRPRALIDRRFDEKQKYRSADSSFPWLSLRNDSGALDAENGRDGLRAPVVPLRN